MSVSNPAVIFLGLSGVAALVDWWAVHRRNKPVEYVAKPAALIALIAVALTLDVAVPARRDWFVAALVFSLAGDVLLMLRRSRFLPGLVSFLVAHVAYIGGFTLAAGDTAPADRFALPHPAAFAGGMVVVLAVTWLAGRRIVRGALAHDRRLGAPVGAYMVAITVMVLAAMADGNPLALAGALLFFASDALIGFDRFVAPAPWMPLGIIVAYHLGQAGLVLSLAYPA